MRSVALTFALGAGLAPGAHAEGAGWRLYTEALTEVPLQVGAGVVAEGPGRLRYGLSVGYLPGPYVDLINNLLVSTEVYSQTTADLIEVALTNSVLWEARVGWRPIADLGTYVDVSYTLMGLGGGTTDQDTLVSGAELPRPSGSEKPSYRISSGTHLLGVEAGYLFEFDSGLTLRAGMGMAITVATDFTVDAKGGVVGREAIEKASEDYLESVFERWVHPPAFSFSAGYRFL